MVFSIRSLVGVAVLLFTDVEALRSTSTSSALSTAAVSEAAQEKAVRSLVAKDIVSDKLADMLVQEAFLEARRETGGGGSGTAAAVAKTLAPLLDDVLSGLLKGMRPIFRDVCQHVVEEVTLESLEHGGVSLVSDLKYVEVMSFVSDVNNNVFKWRYSSSFDAGGDFGIGGEDEDGISYIAFVESVSSNTGFWDNIKGKLFGDNGLLGPAVLALGKMIKPVMEKLGQKASPKFGHAMKKILEKACKEAKDDVENGSL